MIALAAASIASAMIATTAFMLCRRYAAQAAAERRDLLRDCMQLFDEEPMHGVDRAGFGSLSGRVHGLRVNLTLLAESLAFRRLPQLWLRVEVRAEMGGVESLGVVRRPTNAEFYSPVADLPIPYDVPPRWPPDTLIRGTACSQALMRRLTDHADPLFSDPRLKEILLTPRGLRVSRQAAEGERGTYLLFRGSRFEEVRIEPRHVRGVLDETLKLAHALLRKGDHDAGRHACYPAQS